jgi:hypothetical protein
MSIFFIQTDFLNVKRTVRPLKCIFKQTLNLTPLDTPSMARIATKPISMQYIWDAQLFIPMSEFHVNSSLSYALFQWLTI